MWKRSKQDPTGSYFYMAIQLANCMMRINSHVGPVITKMTNTQNMNIYEMNTQKILNLHVCSSDESEKKDQRGRNIIACMF